MSNNNGVMTEVVFEYTGKGCMVPENISSVRFHPSVIEVEFAFHDRKQLREVISRGRYYSMSSALVIANN